MLSKIHISPLFLTEILFSAALVQVCWIFRRVVVRAPTKRIEYYSLLRNGAKEKG